MESTSYTGRVRSRSTTRQLECLVELMLQNKDLALGKYCGPLGFLKCERLWRTVASKLSAFGPKKTHIQAKTTWRDFKKKVRKKNALVNKLRREKGTDESMPVLTDLELKVLNILNNANSDVGDVEHEEEELDLFSIPLEGNSDETVDMCIEQNQKNEDNIKDYTIEEKAAGNDSNPLFFVDVLQDTPVAAESFVSPTNQTASTTNELSYDEMNDVAGRYADLQTETNKTFKEMISIFKKYSENSLNLLKERNEIERERNKLMKERNEIEANSNKLKLMEMKMQMKNGSQINDKDKDDL